MGEKFCIPSRFTQTSSNYSRGEKVQMPSLPLQDCEKGYVDFTSKSTHQEFL